MRELGPISYFQGIAVTRHGGGLYLLEEEKITNEILERVGMS